MGSRIRSAIGCAVAAATLVIAGSAEGATPGSRRDLYDSPPVDTVPAHDSLATFRGTVADSTGKPIQLATIVVDGDMVTTHSRADGTFGPLALPAGHHRLIVGALGFRMTGANFDVIPGAAARFSITMIPDGTQLAEVHITGKQAGFSSETLRASGFEERREKGTGRYIDETQIAARTYPQLSELLRDLSGVRLQPVSTTYGGTVYVLQMRGSTGLHGICMSPSLYLDGVPIDLPTGDASALDHLIQSRDIAGVEVYPSASSVPSRFKSAEATCGAIVIWTKGNGGM